MVSTTAQVAGATHAGHSNPRHRRRTKIGFWQPYPSRHLMTTESYPYLTIIQSLITNNHHMTSHVITNDLFSRPQSPPPRPQHDCEHAPSKTLGLAHPPPLQLQTQHPSLAKSTLSLSHSLTHPPPPRPLPRRIHKITPPLQKLEKLKRRALTSSNRQDRTAQKGRENPG